MSLRKRICDCAVAVVCASMLGFGFSPSAIAQETDTLQTTVSDSSTASSDAGAEDNARVEDQDSASDSQDSQTEGDVASQKADSVGGTTTNSASSAARTLGDQPDAVSAAMPENPSYTLPERVADSLPDDASVVGPDAVALGDGTYVSLSTGEPLQLDASAFGDEGQVDPLALSGGRHFVPITVRQVREAMEQPANHAETYALPGNSYGAYWGTYNDTPAFFEADGTLFAQQAKGVIDVSEHQGTIDWQAVKNAGVDGAIIRVSFGRYNRFDKEAQRNINECKRLGIPFGVYFYSYAYDTTYASDEGSTAVSYLRQLGVAPGDLSYPVFYDLENWLGQWPGYAPPTSPSAYEAIVNAWYAKLTAAGYTNLSVYSYTSYLNGPLNTSSIRNKTRWVASYGTRTGFTFSTNDRGWQYSETGSIAGISGPVDLNAFGNKEYVHADFPGMDLMQLGTPKCDIEPGTYYLLLRNGKTLDVDHASLADAANIVAYPLEGSSNQRFVIRSKSNCQYQISAEHSGKVLDASGPSSRNGTPIIQFADNGQLNQRWEFYCNSAGYCYIASVYAGTENKVIDVVNVDTSGVSSVNLWAANGGDNQGFRLVPSGDYLADADGWVVRDGVRRWYDKGIMARNKEVYDPSQGAWYFFGTDGLPTTGIVSLSDGREVYYDADGRMLYGQHYIGGNWYYFDPASGSMSRNVDVWLAEDSKWVHYDEAGHMVYGQHYINGAWYFFDTVTGAMAHGVTWLSDESKWVYYDIVTGRMQYGLLNLNYDAEHIGWYYFLPGSGAMQKGSVWVPEWNQTRWFDLWSGKLAD